MKQFLLAAVLLLLPLCHTALAVPETVSARITDVTTSSFSIVWMTSVAADPAVEVYADSSMSTPLSDGIIITPMPDASQDVAAAAKARGVMKVRVSGLAAATKYFVRSVSRDPVDPASVGYSTILEITTASLVAPYAMGQDGLLQGFTNDLATMKVYIQPGEQQSAQGMGELLLLEMPSAAYPLSTFIGIGTSAPEGVIDLNNLFGQQLTTSLWAKGGENAQLRVYRGGTLATLLHYRRLPLNSGFVAAVEPVKGFYADINLDGKVDDADFEEFRKQYRTSPNDDTYNPDFKFITTPSGKIEAQDFASFAKQYGRADVPQQ
ncbi:MAG: hypothetical protein PHP95_12430 [Desulfuromonadaceae bacterium]|nr:hypothetical protein [Desulfuromonadaceae bacterium]MDD2849250.1 hypothetical protein [Desulfuromonadaceae bacterium]MDD4131877.1 hypothetical protein [Desulfuromonadaceae bacterium]